MRSELRGQVLTGTIKIYREQCFSFKIWYRYHFGLVLYFDRLVGSYWTYLFGSDCKLLDKVNKNIGVNRPRQVAFRFGFRKLRISKTANFDENCKNHRFKTYSFHRNPQKIRGLY